jgi:hypothetical protein
MIEVGQLAQEVVNLVGPVLIAAKSLAGKAEEEAAKELGKTVFGWLRDRFKGKPAEKVLDQAQAEPGDQQLRYLRRAIEDTADDSPEFHRELEKLLESGRASIQVARIAGDNGKIVQNSGDRNRITLK